MHVFGIDTPPQNASEQPWRCKIDYLSITSGEFHVPIDNANLEEPQFCTSGSFPCRMAGLTALDDGGSGAWSPLSGRSGYRYSSGHSIGARLFFGHANGAPLLECGGAACDTLQAAGQLMPFLFRNTEGVTRIDLAADLVTDVSPAEFVAAGYSARVGSVGAARSATGETEYIGSPKSDRMCRVYRYAPPHPRSDALRVEVVLRREAAKSAAQLLISSAVSSVYAAAVRSFGFRHRLSLEATSDVSPLATLPRERTAAGRLRWLITQIRPAVLSAHRDGLIDLAKWLDEALADD